MKSSRGLLEEQARVQTQLHNKRRKRDVPQEIRDLRDAMEFSRLHPSKSEGTIRVHSKHNLLTGRKETYTPPLEKKI